MNPETFRTILEVKTAMLDRRALELADLRRKIVEREALALQLEASLRILPESAASGAALCAAISWRNAQSCRLVRLRSETRQLEDSMAGAEAAVGQALGEKRAIERLCVSLA